MKTYPDVLIGDTFGDWTIIEPERVVSPRARRVVKCRCLCGQTKEISVLTLYAGGTAKCKRCAARMRGSRSAFRLKSKEFTRFWHDRLKHIIQRCTDPTFHDYHNYGGRGIQLHPDWADDHKKFFDYVTTLPGWDDQTLEIDRIDNNRGYEPGNIRFTTRVENARNMRKTLFVTVDGKRITMREFQAVHCPNWKIPRIQYRVSQRKQSGDFILAEYRKMNA